MPFRFPRLTPTVKKLLIALAAAFVATAVLEQVVGLPAFGYLSLDLTFGGGSYLNLAWQPLTYWLAYPPQPNALINFMLMLLFIYLFLAPFEEGFGTKRTVQLAISGIVPAALASIALAMALGPLGVALPPASYVLYGAEPIAFAAFGAFAVRARGAEIYFMFLVRMKAWHALLLGVGLAALSAVLAQNPFILVEEVAALGGGALFVHWLMRPRTPKKAVAPKKKRRGGPDLRVVRGGGEGDPGGDDDQPRWLN